MGKSKELAELGDVVTQDGGNMLVGTTSHFNYSGGTTEITVGTDATGSSAGGAMTFVSNNGATTLGYAGFQEAEAQIGTMGSRPLKLTTDNTARLTIDASGRVTMPSQPAFRAYSTVSAWTLLSSNTWVIAALESEDYDRGSNYNTTNYRFTAPIAGLYQFTLHAYARVQSGGQGDNSYYWTARFGINGQTQGVHCIVGYFSDGDEDNTCTVTSTFNLSANDYVEVYLRGHSSSAEYYRSLCSFEGRLVG